MGGAREAETEREHHTHTQPILRGGPARAVTVTLSLKLMQFILRGMCMS